MPQEPEVMGLLALLLYQDSRRAARTAADGSPITLDEQDRTRWDRTAIAEANALLADAARHRAVGMYQIEAAIASVQANAATPAAVDWPALASLYDALFELAPSPVVALNRAVAIGYARGPQAGYDAVTALPVAELEDYYLYHVVRADALRRLGDRPAARAGYARALELAQTRGRAGVSAPHDRRARCRFAHGPFVSRITGGAGPPGTCERHLDEIHGVAVHRCRKTAT